MFQCAVLCVLQYYSTYCLTTDSPSIWDLIIYFDKNLTETLLFCEIRSYIYAQWDSGIMIAFQRC